MTANPSQTNQETPEKILLSAVSNGDETAFRRLFESWYGFLASHIFRITGSNPVTEEIVQDVFLKIWLTRETLAEINDFKAYLIIVSRNHALNALRKIAADERKHQQWLNESNGENVDPSIIYYSLIDEAIDQLTTRQKEVYLLHRHQRLTYNSIAHRLHLSRETVKSHLQSAIASITKYIRNKLSAWLLLVLLQIFRYTIPLFI